MKREKKKEERKKKKKSELSLHSFFLKDKEGLERVWVGGLKEKEENGNMGGRVGNRLSTKERKGEREEKRRENRGRKGRKGEREIRKRELSKALFIHGITHGSKKR